VKETSAETAGAPSRSELDGDARVGTARRTAAMRLGRSGNDSAKARASNASCVERPSRSQIRRLAEVHIVDAECGLTAAVAPSTLVASESTSNERQRFEASLSHASGTGSASCGRWYLSLRRWEVRSPSCFSSLLSFGLSRSERCGLAIQPRGADLTSPSGRSPATSAAGTSPSRSRKDRFRSKASCASSTFESATARTIGGIPSPCSLHAKPSARGCTLAMRSMRLGV
jgi:hypothetical protein